MRYSFVHASLLALVLTIMPASAQDASDPVEPSVTPAPLPIEALPPRDDGTAQLTAADLSAWLDGFIPHALGRADIPGAVVVVVKDGKPLIERGYGYADVSERTPVDPQNTLFRPGSISKLVTWTAVMQLVEQGKIDLDADVNQYLDFDIPAYDGKPVTMRNILTHTSGIAETFRGLMAQDLHDSIPLDVYVKWVPTRIFAPGTVPSYSNYATTLAGYIVERLSGQSFDDYVEQHIFDPLGMRLSTFRQPLPEHLQPLMSKGYKPGADEPVDFEIVNPAPAGGMSSPGGDMANFMIAHLQEGAFGDRRILRADTARQMHGTVLSLLPPLNSMALGFYQGDINGHRVITHGGDTVAFHSDLYLFIDDGIGLYISANSPGKAGAIGKLRRALFTGFANRYLPGSPAEESEVDTETAKQHAQQIEGVYLSSRRSDDTFMSLINLFSQIKVKADDTGSLIVPAMTDLGGEPIKWVPVAPYVWRDANGSNRLTAKLVDGKVEMLGIEPFASIIVFQPAPWWKSSAWLLPALMTALTALTFTVLAWPISFFIRRRYRVPYGLRGRNARAHRIMRLTALVVLGVMVLAVGMMASMINSLDMLAPRNDWIVHTLRLLALIVFPIGAAISLWNAWVALQGPRRRWAKFWAIVLALSCLVILWVSIAFRLVGWSALY